MKNKIFKIALLVLSFALLLGATFAMSIGAADGSDSATKPEIISENVAYQGNFALMYAVSAEGITGPVTLNVYESYPSEASVAPIFTQTVAEPEYVEGNLNATAYVFTTRGIAAADMCKQFYIQAVVDDTGAKSEVHRYSLAEYLYERLATTGENAPDEDQALLYKTVIAFGDQAQKVVGKIAEDAQRINNYRFVTVTGGKLDKYFTTGVYPIGTTLPLTADESGVGIKWTVTPYTNGTAGTPLTNQTSVTVADATRIHVTFGSSSAVVYTEGYRDLEDLATYYDAGTLEAGTSTYNTAGFGSSGLGIKLFTKLEDSHGMVMYSDKVTSSAQLKLDGRVTGNKSYSEDATAYELSFDMKMKTEGNNANDRIVIKVSGGGKTLLPWYFMQYDNDMTLSDKLSVKRDGGETLTLADVNPSDWFHVRFMVYENEKNAMYLYINGNTDEGMYCKWVFQTDVNFESMYTGQAVSILGLDAAVEETVYLDNIYIGYTNATNPHTEAAEQ